MRFAYFKYNSVRMGEHFYKRGKYYLRVISIIWNQAAQQPLYVKNVGYNVQPNPGPPSSQIATPADFKSRSGLGFIHLNVRSLLSKLDFVRIWASSTDADVIVLSETWLKKSISASDISLNGNNVYRADRPNKGGGVAIYVKNTFCVTTLVSKSISKQLKCFALNIEVAKGQQVMVVGCYSSQGVSVFVGKSFIST